MLGENASVNDSPNSQHLQCVMLLDTYSHLMGSLNAYVRAFKVEVRRL